ncbi:hypothetical protein GGS21DRAFT_489550 [Xylaria nigripes]|nr:hypothetical protein GGS21DRAFT_489550 [Xylaria nigripes]
MAPLKKPIVRPGYVPPRPINSIRKTYSTRRKVEVLLFLENHRIPLQKDHVGWPIQPSGSQLLAGATTVEEGFRRPFLREAAAYFKISSIKIISCWWAKWHKIFGPHVPRHSLRSPGLETRL